MKSKKIALVMMLLQAMFALSFAGEIHLNQNAGKVEATAHATGHDFQAIPERFTLDGVLNDEGELSLDQVVFAFDLTDLKTGKKKRDKEMLHWLEAEHHPKLEYKMTGSRREGDQQILLGQVSLHGQTQPVEIPVKLSKKEDKVLCVGDFTLTTTDFGLEKIRKMLMLTVDTEVKIHFELDLSAKNDGI